MSLWVGQRVSCRLSFGRIVWMQPSNNLQPMEGFLHQRKYFGRIVWMESSNNPQPIEGFLHQQILWKDCAQYPNVICHMSRHLLSAYVGSSLEGWQAINSARHTHRSMEYSNTLPYQSLGAPWLTSSKVLPLFRLLLSTATSMLRYAEEQEPLSQPFSGIPVYLMPRS